MNVKQMKKAELIDELKKHGLPHSGKVSDMRSRLQLFLNELANKSKQKDVFSRDSLNNTTLNATNASQSMSRIDEKIREKDDEIKQKNAEIRALLSKIQRNQQFQHDSDRSRQREKEIFSHSRNRNATQWDHSMLNRSERYGMFDTSTVAGDQHTQDSFLSAGRIRERLPSMLAKMDCDEEETAKMAASNATTKFSFRDIEHALNQFAGAENYRIDTWLEEFEEYAVMFKWNDLQKLIYAKRLMRDSAKLFLRSVKTKTFDDLKRALISQFGKKLTSGEAHKLLQQKKKKKDEKLCD